MHQRKNTAKKSLNLFSSSSLPLKCISTLFWSINISLSVKWLMLEGKSRANELSLKYLNNLYIKKANFKKSILIAVHPEIWLKITEKEDSLLILLFPQFWHIKFYKAWSLWNAHPLLHDLSRMHNLYLEKGYHCWNTPKVLTNKNKLPGIV